MTVTGLYLSVAVAQTKEGPLRGVVTPPPSAPASCPKAASSEPCFAFAALSAGFVSAVFVSAVFVSAGFSVAGLTAGLAGSARVIV